MPRATWSLRQGRPVIRVVLTLPAGNQSPPLFLIADTGAGNSASCFELILEERDCLAWGGKPSATVGLGGAYTGPHPVYRVRVQIPELSFDAAVAVAGVPSNPGVSRGPLPSVF